MKKSGIFVLIAAIAFLVTSCHKDPKPEITYNSEIKIGGIQFYNLPPADSIIGNIVFTLAVPNDTIPDKIDTSVLVKKFFPLELFITTQSYYYNLPDNTKSVQFYVSFNIYTHTRTCDSMTVNNFSFIKDNISRINTSFNLNYQSLTYQTTPLLYEFP